MFCLYDTITDILILMWLIEHHPMWALITLFNILSPFFVMYVPFINFMIRGENMQTEARNLKQSSLKCIALTPLIIIVFILMDTIYNIQGLIFPITMIILRILKSTTGVIIGITCFGLPLILWGMTTCCNKKENRIGNFFKSIFEYIVSKIGKYVQSLVLDEIN